MLTIGAEKPGYGLGSTKTNRNERSHMCERVDVVSTYLVKYTT